MKRKKSAVRIALICGAVGLLLCTIAGNSVNDINRVISWPEAHLGNIAFFEISGVKQFLEYEKTSIPSKVDRRDKHVYLDYKGIKNLDIEVELGDVEIQKGKSFRIETYGLPERNEREDSVLFGAYTENQTLYLSVENSKISVGSSVKPRLLITIPENLEKLTIEQNNGSVTMTGIKGGLLEVNSDLGEVKVNQSEFENMFIESDMGQINLAGCKFSQGEFDNDLGSIEIGGICTDSLNAYSDSGSIQLNLKQFIKDVSLDLSADLGEIKVNGVKTKGSSYVSHDGDIQIHAEVDLGSIEANIQQ